MKTPPPKSRKRIKSDLKPLAQRNNGIPFSGIYAIKACTKLPGFRAVSPAHARRIHAHKFLRAVSSVCFIAVINLLSRVYERGTIVKTWRRVIEFLQRNIFIHCRLYERGKGRRRVTRTKAGGSSPVRGRSDVARNPENI